MDVSVGKKRDGLGGKKEERKEERAKESTKRARESITRIEWRERHWEKHGGTSRDGIGGVGGTDGMGQQRAC